VLIIDTSAVPAALVARDKPAGLIERLADEDLSAPHLLDVEALRHNLSAYDAVYVTLAEMLDVPLATCDRRIGIVAIPARCEACSTS